MDSARIQRFKKWISYFPQQITKTGKLWASTFVQLRAQASWTTISHVYIAAGSLPKSTTFESFQNNLRDGLITTISHTNS
jgi:hypothetical protein